MSVTLVPTDKFPRVIYFGYDVDLNEAECFFISQLIWSGNVQILTRPVTYPGPRPFDEMYKKLARIIHDGDARHPGYWPTADAYVESYWNGQPVTINGVTLPEKYTHMLFALIHRAEKSALEKGMITHDQWIELLVRLKILVRETPDSEARLARLS